MILTLVDTSGIQPYIFGSNRLRENIGASYLVAAATDEWARDEATRLDANAVLYTGGGNAALGFVDRETANTFVHNLSRRAMRYAPGLQLVIVHQEWSGETATLADALEDALKKMAQEKDERTHSAPLLGLSVTRQCASTDLPAAQSVKLPDDPHLKVSAAAAARIRADDDATARLNRLLPPPLGFEYPRDFDELGNSFGDQSYLAIVHADGNGLGQRLPSIAKEGADALGNFARAVNEASTTALKTVIDHLAAHSKAGEVFHTPLDESFRLSYRTSAGQTTYKLPIRPLVFGGDDVTFICEGRIGLALAVLYLQQFEKETSTPERMSALGGHPVTACVGVAIVNAHFPFARAYRLAEQLCASAKHYRRKEKAQGSFLDWHFATTGLIGEPEEIRKREYVVRDGNLHLRPVALTLRDFDGANTPVERRTWKFIEERVVALQKPPWSNQRGKVKRLREVLRRGPNAVDSLVNSFDLDADQAKLLAGNGWAGEECTLFDAIELADLYYPLGSANSDGQSGGTA